MSDVGVDPDPDATPTATPWQDYLATAQALDAVVRESAAEVAEANRAVAATQAELAQLTARLEHQRVRIAAAATQAGLAPPLLLPTPAEQAETYAHVAPVPPGEAVRQAYQLLGVADAELAAVPPPARWRPPLWLVIVAPTAAAILLVCLLAVLVLLTR